MGNYRFYVVWYDKGAKIFDSWNSCKVETETSPMSRTKGFQNREDADKASKRTWSEFWTNQPIKRSTTKKRRFRKKTRTVKLGPDKSLSIQKPVQCICVDGTWNPNTKEFGYQVTEYPSGKVILCHGPFPGGTNNIAEWLAVVAGLRYSFDNLLDLPIYTDSTTALAWLRYKKANTKRDSKLIPPEIREAIKDAEDWLAKNCYSNEVLKWLTKLWGENPADFGRK